jgi:hypothetical protein
LDLDTKHYISIYLFIYFCIIIPFKPRIARIRFKNLLIAMAKGLEGKSLGISLLDGGPEGKGILDMNMRRFLNMGDFDYSKDFANFNKN